MTHFTRSQLNVISSPAERDCLSQPALYRTGVIISTRLRAAIIARLLRGCENRAAGVKPVPVVPDVTRVFGVAAGRSSRVSRDIGMRLSRDCCVAVVDPDFAQLRIPSADIGTARTCTRNSAAGIGRAYLPHILPKIHRGSDGIRFARDGNGGELVALDKFRKSAWNVSCTPRRSIVIRSFIIFKIERGNLRSLLIAGSECVDLPLFLSFSPFVPTPSLSLPERKFANTDFNVNWEISHRV